MLRDNLSKSDNILSKDTSEKPLPIDGRMAEKKGIGDTDLCWLKYAKMRYSSLRDIYGTLQRSAAPVRNLQGKILFDNEASIKYSQNTLNSSLIDFHS